MKNKIGSIIEISETEFMVSLIKIGTIAEVNAIVRAAFLFFVISYVSRYAAKTMVDAKILGIILATKDKGMNKLNKAKT